MTARHDRRGWVLLEVLLATVVLGIAAASFAVMLRETATVVERGREHERSIARAERILLRYASRNGAELERSVGRWSEGGMGVRISRLAPSLFEIVVVAPGGDVLLETALYRPAHGAP